jgi:hypothetical protein
LKIIVLTSPGSNRLLHSLGGAVVVLVGAALVVAFAGAAVGGATRVTFGIGGNGGRVIGVGDATIVVDGSMAVVAFAGGVVGGGGSVTVGTGGRVTIAAVGSMVVLSDLALSQTSV